MLNRSLSMLLAAGLCWLATTVAMADTTYTVGPTISQLNQSPLPSGISPLTDTNWATGIFWKPTVNETIVKIEVPTSLTGTHTLYFGVFKKSMTNKYVCQPGGYTQTFSSANELAAWRSSGAISLAVTAGDEYFVGTWWYGENLTTWKQGASGLPTAFARGQLFGSWAGMQNITVNPLAGQTITIVPDGGIGIAPIKLTLADLTTASPTASASPTPSSSPTRTATASPTQSQTTSPTPSASPTATATASVTQTPLPPVPSSSPTRTASPTASVTATKTGTPTASVSASPTASSSPTSTPTATASPTKSQTASPTPSASQTATATVTASATPTPLPPVPSSSPTRTASPTASVTATKTGTPTASVTATMTATASPTKTATASRTPTASPTPSASQTATATVTASATPTPCEEDRSLFSGNTLLGDNDSDGIRFYLKPGAGKQFELIFTNPGWPCTKAWEPDDSYHLWLRITPLSGAGNSYRDVYLVLLPWISERLEGGSIPDIGNNIYDIDITPPHTDIVPGESERFLLVIEADQIAPLGSIWKIEAQMNHYDPDSLTDHFFGQTTSFEVVVGERPLPNAVNEWVDYE